jgi:signal transduction histidine kinase
MERVLRMAYWDISRFSNRPRLALALRYGVAVISVTLALAATVFTHFHSPPPRFVSHFVLIAIAITFWFGRTGPGLLALLFSCLGVSFLAARHFLTPDFPLTSFLSFFVIFSVLMSLFGASQRRAQKLLREARDSIVGLEARMNERTRIARELHDTLLQSLHGLMFRFQAARNMLPRHPEQAMQDLDSAIARTEQAIAESRGAIQDLRSEPVAQSDLAELLTATGQELASFEDPNRDGAVFHLIVEGQRRRLSPIIQEEVYWIARELLRNAFRHASAHRIEAEIRYEDRLFRLRVRDDGKGMDSKVLAAGGRAGHWGLPGVRERAQKLGARLDFWSEAGAGTEVQLTVPAAVAYERSRDGAGFRLFRKARIHEHQS